MAAGVPVIMFAFQAAGNIVEIAEELTLSSH